MEPETALLGAHSESAGADLSQNQTFLWTFTSATHLMFYYHKTPLMLISEEGSFRYLGDSGGVRSHVCHKTEPHTCGNEQQPPTLNPPGQGTSMGLDHLDFFTSTCHIHQLPSQLGFKTGKKDKGGQGKCDGAQMARARRRKGAPNYY